MSNTWVPNNDGGNNGEEFDLFAPNTEDDLHEVLAKGAYKWTNKFTAVFAFILLIVTTTSAGIWYGHRSAASATTSLSGASGFSRSGFTRGNFGGGGAVGNQVSALGGNIYNPFSGYYTGGDGWGFYGE